MFFSQPSLLVAVAGSGVLNSRKLGLQAGWPDIQLVYQGRYFGLEVKTQTGKTFSSAIRLTQKTDLVTVPLLLSLGQSMMRWRLLLTGGLARKHKQNVESRSSASTT